MSLRIAIFRRSYPTRRAPSSTSISRVSQKMWNSRDTRLKSVNLIICWQMPILSRMSSAILKDMLLSHRSRSFKYSKFRAKHRWERPWPNMEHPRIRQARLAWRGRSRKCAMNRSNSTTCSAGRSNSSRFRRSKYRMKRINTTQKRSQADQSSQDWAA